ncbi:thiamine phosphate synthase [Salinarimonas soli]|uniref:Thiamine phosphate synthase n=1 Tax=Salinarimonas soli TaxID=1638099 RepID=A0A5B2V1J1_9HYPH|nr:thiamine phosphate synthase [Salinarimonas soli]KAA2233433.1 thiamine phosphate synthase [Salinarimonas soli]
MRAVSTSQLYLVTPIVDQPDAFAPLLSAACSAGTVAAVQLRLAAADERTLVKALKALCPVAQENGAAVLLAVVGEAPVDLDLVLVAARGGADGVHVEADLEAVHELRGRLKDERILGVGGVRSKHDAMSLGEEGVDYLLFGEPRRDGSLPHLDSVEERAAWWAEIFETPCVAFAPDLAAVPRLAATRAEFVALGDAVWTHEGGPAAAVRAAAAALRDGAGA